MCWPACWALCGCQSGTNFAATRLLEELQEASGGTGGAVDLDISVFDLTADLFGDRRRDPLWRRVVKVHAATGSVAFEPMADVEVLLEVVAQRK